MPVDLAGSADLAKLEEKGVKGRYVSVERLKELENGKVEWQMATSSTPGGKIPSFIAESTMDSTISQVSLYRCGITIPVSRCSNNGGQDVTHFLHWFHGIRSKSEPASA